MHKFSHKIIAAIIVVGLAAIMFAPLSVNRQRANETSPFLQPAVADAMWGMDAGIKIAWETAWRDYIRVKLIDLGKFLKLQATIKLIQKALDETELGGMVRNYRSFIFDDLADKALDTIDVYFDDYLPDTVSPNVKRTAKAIVNNEIRSVDGMINTLGTQSVTSNKQVSTSQSSTSSTALLNNSEQNFSQKTVAWVKTFFKAQFVGTKALSPNNPLIAFAYNPVPTQWKNSFSNFNQFIDSVVQCNGSETCNDSLAALKAVDKGMKEYNASQLSETIRTLVLSGYNTERDKDGNETQWPGLAKAMLEGNVQQFATIISNSEDYTPSPVTTMIGAFIINYVFNSHDNWDSLNQQRFQ
ncbi:hypothetical protein ACFL1U_00500 [Patescibacteria group bacterium]